MEVYKPLDGILVISLEHALSAPFATCRLADAGARVIKIERDTGDFARFYDEVVQGQSTYFTWVNRGKESISLNIKADEDRQLFLKLIKKADVFIQNLSPGALQRIGLDSESLRKLNSKLITVDISGYGEEGEYSEMRAYDNLVQCESGLIDVTGDGDTRAKVGISIADISAGIHAYSAVLEALIQRGKTGDGVGIKISMFDCMSDWMMVPYLHEVYGGSAPPRTGVHHAAISPYGPFQTSDGKTIVIAIQNEREWKRFCENVLNNEIRSDDADFGRNSARVRNRDKLNAAIQTYFSGQTHHYLLDKLKKYDIAFANLKTMSEFAKHPQLRLTEVESESGSVHIAEHPVRIQGFKQIYGPIPALNEHGDKIRKEFDAD